MNEMHVTMAANGRIVVPSQVRSSLGMEKGGGFVMTVDERGTIHLEPLRNIIARVQDEVRGYIPDDVDLADELSVDRRQEAAHE
ncbi:AbrB/MazE/SpoVT family DNA-binding domain-containing protein [Magnetospirillum moscoviense]|uniref:AbrB/MazE/SpoVT family DNA-binding domain-containing protein n=1 Tax=Magnetospirillum moscoviense TaxID=1437059 RepID=UPI000AC4E8DC|nr:AbrB/MazE/SpoVT family DNA-binding domain-containing protein [Magnetospirillum moscoviense]